MRFYGLPLVLACAPVLSSEAPRPNLPASETLTYSIEWRLITAGTAKLHWSSVESGWESWLELNSTGLVSKLFKVDDDYKSSMGPDLCASSSRMKILEGRKNRETSVTFDREARKAAYLEKDIPKNAVVDSHEIDIPACVHDVTGGLYYLRTLRLEPGQSAQVPVSDGKKSVMAKVEAQQREEIKTPAGTFKTVRYEAYLFNNVLFRRAAHLYVWFSEDERRIPVQIRVRMPITIGTITLQLEKIES